MRIYRIAAMAVASWALAGWLACSEGSEEDGEDGGEALELATEPDVGGEAEVGGGSDQAGLDYPAPPYGVKAGATVADYSFVDPAGGGELSMGTLYGHGSKKVLLLTSGAGWCSACKAEAVELNDLYAQWSGKGLEIWSTLFQDYAGDAPDEVFWKKWTTQLKPAYPVLLDPGFVLGAFFDADSAPMNMLVRLDTMAIVFVQTGFDLGFVTAEIDKLLD